jgi:hypothetical protein
MVLEQDKVTPNKITLRISHYQDIQDYNFNIIYQYLKPPSMKEGQSNLTFLCHK